MKQGTVAATGALSGIFWNLFAALFAYHLFLLVLQKLGLVKSK
jgi:hypothetical protein